MGATLLLAAVGAVVNAAVSKRCRHRKWFIVWPGLVCALGLAVLGPLIERSGAGTSITVMATSAPTARYQRTVARTGTTRGR